MLRDDDLYWAGKMSRHELDGMNTPPVSSRKMTLYKKPGWNEMPY